MIGVDDAAGLTQRWQEFQQCYRQDRFSEALAMLMAFPKSVHNDFLWVAHRADLLGKIGDHEGEISLLDELMLSDPTVAGLWVSKANALKTLGRTAEAVDMLRRAIAIQPTYGKPWWLLSDLKSFRFDDDDVAAMATLLDAGVDISDRIPLHFAIAKAFEDRGDAGQAFDHYAAGNRLRASMIGPTGNVVSAKVGRSIELFTTDFIRARNGQGSPTTAPIFIVGLQRSGSTLIEQILASHPLIEGTSELPLIPQLNREIAIDPSLPRAADLFGRIESLAPDRLRALGDAYVARSATFRKTDRPFFVDKLPANWTNLGFIRLILPGAKIVDARRHPLATGFSNFKQYYGSGAAFSFDLATIGQYYRDYLRLMSHFERVDPGSVHRVINEQLVDDFEPQVRALLAYIGVEFDPACLEFHTNRRAVATPSAEQVRRPINRDGVDQWRAFEPLLGPLKHALGSALAGWDLPAGEYRDVESD